MTKEERESLLKKVAEVAPEDLNAEFVLEPCVYLESSPCKYASQPERIIASECDLHLVNDFNDAEAIIAMLDAMEKAGWAACVGSRIDEDGVRIPGYCCDCYDTDNCEPLSMEGSTRAEAASRAFVQVFDKEAAE